MIVIKVELHSAITKQVTHLGTMHISNDGTGDMKYGNYWIGLITKNFKVGRAAYVKKHNRAGLSVWVLIAKAIKALYKAAPELVVEEPKGE